VGYFLLINSNNQLVFLVYYKSYDQVLSLVNHTKNGITIFSVNHSH